MGSDSAQIDTNSAKLYYYTCEYKSGSVELLAEWDGSYDSPDEELALAVSDNESNEPEETTLSSKDDFINYVRDSKTPTFEKNCRIGYLLESIMTENKWEYEASYNKGLVTYTGSYNSQDVEIVFEFINGELPKPATCKIGTDITDSAWDILNIFADFEDIYLEELELHPSLNEFYKFYSPPKEPTRFEQDYILPDSDKRYYTAAELESLSAEELRYARNEIYARHGLIFEDWDLKNYFLRKSWYHGSNSIRYFDDSCFNEYERANLQLIIDMENN